MGFQWFSCFNESSQLVELIRVDPFGSSAALLRLTFQSKASMACGTKQPAKRNQTIYTNESWEWDGISLIFWRSTLIIHLIGPYYISYNILSLNTSINMISVFVWICMKFLFPMIHFAAFQFWPVRSPCSLLESTWTKVVQEANRRMWRPWEFFSHWSKKSKQFSYLLPSKGCVEEQHIFTASFSPPNLKIRWFLRNLSPLQWHLVPRCLLFHNFVSHLVGIWTEKPCKACK